MLVIKDTITDDTNLLYTNKSMKKVNKHINPDLSVSLCLSLCLCLSVSLSLSLSRAIGILSKIQHWYLNSCQRQFITHSLIPILFMPPQCGVKIKNSLKNCQLCSKTKQ